MRIEPTTPTLRRQSSMRRHKTGALNPAASRGEGSFSNTGSVRNNDAGVTKIAGKDIVALHQRAHDQSQLSTKRWRAFVPFIAQYIGQETATETPARAVRRHADFARETYKKQVSSTPGPRIMSSI